MRESIPLAYVRQIVPLGCGQEIASNHIVVSGEMARVADPDIAKNASIRTQNIIAARLLKVAAAPLMPRAAIRKFLTLLVVQKQVLKSRGR